MAPEQLSRLAYSTASDVYALGVLFFELYAQTLPWEGLSNMQVAHHVLSGETLSVEAAPNETIALLMKQCWSEKQSERPETSVIASVLISDLNGMTDDESAALAANGKNCDDDNRHRNSATRTANQQRPDRRSHHRRRTEAKESRHTDTSASNYSPFPRGGSPYENN